MYCENYTVEDIVLQWNSTNTSASETTKFFNAFTMLKNFKVFVLDDEGKTYNFGKVKDI